LVERGDLINVGTRGCDRRGWDSVDEDGVGDGTAADRFARRQETNRPISSRTLGLVEGVVGQDEDLVVRHELRFQFLPGEDRPTDGTGDAQVRCAGFYSVGIATDRIKNAIGEDVGFLRSV